MSSTPTWFQVARRPKWVGAFFLAMAFAAICALLAQWQASRSFEKAVTEQQITVAKTLEEVVAPNQPAPQGAVGTLVNANLMVDYQNTYVIAHRFQKDGSEGFWLIGRARDLEGNTLALTLGFANSYESALHAKTELSKIVHIQAFTKVEGLLMPSEAPLLTDAAKPFLFESMSLAQLENLWPDEKAIYPLFMLTSKPDVIAPGLEPISVNPPSVEVQINWLSAFYAIEWSVFCGFAFFLWWRLVRDQQLREAGVL
ncbi:MAG: SURF1 family cytochrome oxidase biogenesis protein [Micrococcales bacterium]